MLKYLAYGLGGVALLGGSFFLFAALSGTPMSQIMGVGSMFPERALPIESSDELPTPEEELARDVRPAAVVVEAARSPLHTFLLPAPFSASDLEDLEQRLQNRMNDLAIRERQLEERERQVEEDRQHYQKLFAELEGLRTSILEMDEERIARADELTRDREAAAAREEKSYRDLAKFYEEGKAKDMAAMLADVFEPDKAALILSSLDPERAGALLSEIYRLDPAQGAAFQEAFRKAPSAR